MSETAHRQFSVQNFVVLLPGAPMSLDDVQAYNEANGLQRITTTKDWEQFLLLLPKFAEAGITVIFQIREVMEHGYELGVGYIEIQTDTGKTLEVRDWEWWSDEGEKHFSVGAALIFMR
jgi:hypothetical protein